MRKIRRRRVATLQPFGQAGPDALLVSLGDLSAAVADRLHYHFHGVAAVEVVHGDLLDLKAIDDFHRGEAQRRVTAAIREQFLGELPVGAALVVGLPARRFPFVVAAPTMRIPGSVRGSLNAYLSMRAALVAVLRHNAAGGVRIRTLAVPGLGTGVGGLDPDEAAAQMRAAYDNVVGGGWVDVTHPALARSLSATAAGTLAAAEPASCGAVDPGVQPGARDNC